MASFSIHLAVGKRYLENNIDRVKDEDLFYQGIIAPDLTNDKKITHYSLPYGDVWQDNVIGKVFLPDYIFSGKYDGSDYELGVFIHLVTDYIFFCFLIERKYMDSVSFLTFCNDLYYSYDCSQKFLDTKYAIDYSNIREIVDKNIAEGIKNKHVDFEHVDHKNIFTNEQLCNFVEYVSSIDIDKYISKIKKYKTNVLPDEKLSF
ncbi:MAG: hypothetical protein E7354_03165 [Clostridiales bacterium]|nr:hypothetical protein [Clostridiales bacterium]